MSCIPFGVIFEVVLKKDGKLYDVGSVLGGGRYDNLVGMFSKNKKQVPCVGISFGIERIITVLERLLKDSGKIPPNEIDVFVGSIDLGFESLPPRINVCSKFWDVGIRAEFGQKKKSRLNDQFDYCEENRIPIMVYFGESEWKKSMVKIRKMYHNQPTEGGFIRKKEVDCSVDNVVEEVRKLLSEQ